MLFCGKLDSPGITFPWQPARHRPATAAAQQEPPHCPENLCNLKLSNKSDIFLTALFWTLLWTGGYRKMGCGSAEESGTASCPALCPMSFEEMGTVRGCPRDALIVTCIEQSTLTAQGQKRAISAQTPLGAVWGT